MVPETCIIKTILIDPYQIHYLRFIMEAYEGLGVVTTLDPKTGLVQLSIAPGCEDDVLAILEAEKAQLKLHSVSLDIP